MQFQTDSSTLYDLDLFPETPGQKGVFDLFEMTRTIGGNELMRAMLQSPQSNIKSLTDRRDSINFFVENNIVLEITKNELDFTEYYLAYDQKYANNDFAISIITMLKNKIQVTPKYYIISTGVNGLLKLLSYTSSVITRILTKNPNEYLKQRCKESNYRIEKIIGNNTHTSNKKLNFFTVKNLDNLFRRKLLSDIKELVSFIYELDVYETAAQVVIKKKWCLPVYGPPSSLLHLKGLFHPLINNAVGNDITVSKDVPLTIVTGPNMAGKSSFLKSIGLATYLAHTGFPVPANRMETAIFTGLVTTINLPDNIQQGLSHYYSEVRRIKETALKIASGNKLVIVFDELFRGTNPKDALEASLLIINSLSKIDNCLFFISTHLAELGLELKEAAGICFKCFDCYFDGETPKFTYKLTDGTSNERLGMRILKNEGVIEILENYHRIQESNKIKLSLSLQRFI